MTRTFSVGSLLLSLVLGFLAVGSARSALAQQGFSAAPLEEETEQSHRREIVLLGQDLTLKKNETCRHVVVIGGNATIEGTVEGDLVVVFGSAKVTGKIERNLVVVCGPAQIRNGARIERNAIVVGGKIDLDPASRIRGARREFVLEGILPDLRWTGDWVRKGLFLFRPLPPQFDWVWTVAALFGLLYFLTAAVFPQPVLACVNALENKPASSFFVGILGLVLLGPLLGLLVISVAGILVIPFLLATFLGAAFLGKLAVYRTTGQQLGKAFNLPGLQQPWVALLIGLVIFYLLYTVPILGFAVWGIALVWGLGAVLVAIFSTFRREHEPPLMTTSAVFARPASPTLSETTVGTPPPVSADAISLQRAGFWIRLWATLLDFVLLGILLALIGPGFLIVWLAYHVAMWTWKGTTMGGIVAGIKILRADGQPLDFTVALVRSLASVFSAVVLFLGFFWAGWNKEKQAWHDKIAGTVVVKVPKGVSLF